jgi:rhodanese-related sulfurtransferase
MVYDALDMTYRAIKIRKDPDCPLCGPNATQTGLLEDYEAFCGTISQQAMTAAQESTISVRTLKAMIDDEANFVLIDVREPNEFEIVRIPGSILIPKQQILDGSALASLPQTKQIVLHCKSGARSAECLAVVKAAGFADAVHVGGGVLAWAREIDPSLPVY